MKSRRTDCRPLKQVEYEPIWRRSPVSRWWFAVLASGTLAAYGIITLALTLEGS